MKSIKAKGVVFGFRFALFICISCTYLNANTQTSYAIKNPIHSSQIQLFNLESDRLIQVMNQHAFVYDTKTQSNKEIKFNFDSIILVCYKSIFRANADSAIKIRSRLRLQNADEITIYGFKNIDDKCYFFFSLRTVTIDTFDNTHLTIIPTIFILKTDLDFTLLKVHCTSTKYVKNLIYISPSIPNGGICMTNDSSLLLPLYHPGITTIRDHKYLNENITDDCIGQFSLNKNHISLIQTKKIDNIYNLSMTFNGPAAIDNVIGDFSRPFAYLSHVPIVYDIKNKTRINFYEPQEDTLLLIQNVENKNYDILQCFADESLLSVIFCDNEKVVLGNYSLKNYRKEYFKLDILKKHIPLSLKGNIYKYALVTEENIQIQFLRIF